MLAKSTTESSALTTFIVGTVEVMTADDAVATGQTIAQYAPLGRVTASGELIESVPGAVDGSQVPVAIAVHAIDTTGGAARHPTYKGGIFNADEVVWDAAWTAAQKAGAFDGTPIALVTPA